VGPETRSSISLSEETKKMSRPPRPKKKPPRRGYLFFNRLSVTALATLGLLLLVGALRPRLQLGIPAEVSEIRKLEWRENADLVIAGDSRSEGGVSPAKMKNVLGDERILNFAFSDNGYTREYLEALPRVLDSKSPRRAILVGVSPFALTPALQRGGFLLADRPAWYRFRWNWFGGLFQFFRPMDKWEAINFARGKWGRGFFRNHHEDGWLEGELVPPKPTFALEKIEREYKNSKVDPEVVDRVTTSVRTWREAGIEVYGFRTPASEEVVKRENEVAEFDEHELGRRFEEAGGHWLSIPSEGWTTYDGSHLTIAESLRLSALLAEKIRAVRSSTIAR
jgi:hypothetical protein